MIWSMRFLVIVEMDCGWPRKGGKGFVYIYDSLYWKDLVN